MSGTARFQLPEPYIGNATTTGARGSWFWLCGFVLIFAALASQQGVDGSWDLRNYHIYNGEAALGNRSALDIAVAQQQTYFNPALDIIYALLRHRISSQSLLAVMAIPQGIAAFLAWRIALAVIPPATFHPKVLAALAVLFGATGAAGLPTLGTTMSEMIPACFVLGGLLLLVERRMGAPWRSAYAGLLFGIAVGLKLVIATALLGVGVALLMTPGHAAWQRIREAVPFGLGATVGLLLISGIWWLKLYHAYGNPLFPYYNNLFHSPWVAADRLTDDRFKPSGWVQAIFYPFYWGRYWQMLVTERWTRDPRFALAYVAIIIFVGFAVLRRFAFRKVLLQADSRASFLVIFFSATFVAWEAMFSILRYLAPIELLAGVVVVLPCLCLTLPARLRLAPHALLVGLLGMAATLTVYPVWDRGGKASVISQVVVPSLPDNSLVVLMSDAPMGYLAAYAPKTVPFVGANNNLVTPGQQTLLARQVEVTIRTHAGPLWGLESRQDHTGAADRTLAYYGLHRGDECAPVRSGLDSNDILMCPLYRISMIIDN